ncbi:MAG: metal ABC transporter permease [Pirellulaceae bacterium]
MHTVWAILSDWGSLDTWIVVTAMLAAMSCAVPGVYLFVRRQSMMGDALSHTALPGIAIAFLATLALRNAGWISAETYLGWRHAAVVTGAVLMGVLSAVLTETVQRVGQVEANAALGVVFTSLFAIGLLLVRLFADKVDLDPDCVLYGTIETAVMDRSAWFGWPRAAVVNGLALCFNLLLVGLFFKELRLAAFDPALATSMGIPAQLVYYVLTSVTAVTLVAAFESVGSILVIAMLVVPAATAHLLVDRLGWLLGCALLVAALSAVLGHVLAITLPALVLPRWGFDASITASTAGMMAVASGLLFVVAALFGPRYGLLTQLGYRMRLALQVAAEDQLGILYRREERLGQTVHPAGLLHGGLLDRLARRWLRYRGELQLSAAGLGLTDRGRQHAERIVRAHRLWESYMAKHLPLPGDHLHEAAERVEHYLDGALREKLAAELAAPEQDPHGRTIPAEHPLPGPPPAAPAPKPGSRE